MPYFSSKRGDAGAHDGYFNCFTPIWTSFLRARRYAEAEHLWELALEPVTNWEKANPGERIRKGTAYYFSGMTALLSGDIDRGYLRMHQALWEDRLTHNVDRPDTPSFAFVTLNYSKTQQAFREWVVAQADFLDNFAKSYSQRFQRNFSLDDFQSRFLSTPPNIDIVFSLAHSVARLMKLSTVPEYSTKNDFAGQLELNLLFDITAVIDAAIKAKNTPRWQFIDHSERLLSAAGDPLTNVQLGELNQAFKTDFNATLLALLAGTYALPSGTQLSRFQSDVAIAYGFRNRGAHNLASAQVVWERFHELERIIFGVLFAAVDYLY